VSASSSPSSPTSGAAIVGPACSEIRIVAVMNEQAALKPIAVDHGRSAPVDAVPLVRPVEGRFHRRIPLALDDTIVETGFDGQEAHPAKAATLEREMRRTEQVELLGGHFISEPIIWGT
jgi:hypothetical protein